MDLARRTNSDVCAVLEKLGSNLNEELFNLARLKRGVFSAAEFEAIVHQLSIVMSIRSKYPEARKPDLRHDARPTEAVRSTIDPHHRIFSGDDRTRLRDITGNFYVTPHTPATTLRVEWLGGRQDAIDAFRIAAASGVVSTATIDALMSHVNTAGYVDFQVTISTPPGVADASTRVALPCNQSTHCLNNPYGPTVGVSLDAQHFAASVYGGAISTASDSVDSRTDPHYDPSDDDWSAAFEDAPSTPKYPVEDDSELIAAPDPLSVRMAAEKERTLMRPTVMGLDGKQKSIRRLCKMLYNSKNTGAQTKDRMTRFYNVISNDSADAAEEFMALCSDYVLFFCRIKGDDDDIDSTSVALCIGKVEIAKVPRTSVNKTVVSALHTVSLDLLAMPVSTVVVRPLKLVNHGSVPIDDACSVGGVSGGVTSTAIANSHSNDYLVVDYSDVYSPLHLRGASVGVFPKSETVSTSNADVLAVENIAAAADTLLTRVRGTTGSSESLSSVVAYLSKAPFIEREIIHRSLYREDETSMLHASSAMDWFSCALCNEVFSTQKGDFYHRKFQIMLPQLP